MLSLHNFLALILFGCLLAACQDKPLPILGERKTSTSIKDGKEVVDTIYFTIPNFKFVNQDSQWVTNATFANKIYITDFFFTTCPTICPIMKTQMLRVYEKFKDNPKIAFLSHTLDPKHDTVALLKDFAKKLNADTQKWHFVTGDKDDIFNIAQTSYLVSALTDPNEPGGIVHSGALILIDSKRRIRGYYDGTKEKDVDRLINDLPKLLAEN